MRELIEEVGLPTRLREVGANESDFEALAKQALVDPTIITNPRSVRLEDVVQILKQCY